MGNQQVAEVARRHEAAHILLSFIRDVADGPTLAAAVTKARKQGMAGIDSFQIALALDSQQGWVRGARAAVCWHPYLGAACPPLSTTVVDVLVGCGGPSHSHCMGWK
jgi:hypothetical protein